MSFTKLKGKLAFPRIFCLDIKVQWFTLKKMSGGYFIILFLFLPGIFMNVIATFRFLERVKFRCYSYWVSSDFCKMRGPQTFKRKRRILIYPMMLEVLYQGKWYLLQWIKIKFLIYGFLPSKYIQSPALSWCIA